MTQVFVFKDVPLAEFMYLVFTHILGESYRRRLRSLYLRMYLWRSLCTLYLLTYYVRVFVFKDVPLAEFMYLVFTHILVES